MASSPNQTGVLLQCSIVWDTVAAVGSEDRRLNDRTQFNSVFGRNLACVIAGARQSNAAHTSLLRLFLTTTMLTLKAPLLLAVALGTHLTMTPPNPPPPPAEQLPPRGLERVAVMVPLLIKVGRRAHLLVHVRFYFIHSPIRC